MKGDFSCAVSGPFRSGYQQSEEFLIKTTKLGSETGKRIRISMKISDLSFMLCLPTPTFNTSVQEGISEKHYLIFIKFKLK